MLIAYPVPTYESHMIDDVWSGHAEEDTHYLCQCRRMPIYRINIDEAQKSLERAWNAYELWTEENRTFTPTSEQRRMHKFLCDMTAMVEMSIFVEEQEYVDTMQFGNRRSYYDNFVGENDVR